MREKLRAHPIQLSFILLFFCSLLRINDIFILRLDEIWGEIILSKAMGFLLILFTLYWVKVKPSVIGLHTKNIFMNFIIGAGVFILVYAFAYGIEYGVLLSSNQNPTMILSAIDPKQGVSGGLLFGVWLVLGNVVNALMEDGLFRGMFLPSFLTKYRFWKANVFQSLLFGLWHLIWPVKSFLTGNSSFMGAVMAGLVLFIGSVTSGLIWWYMSYKTDSLWTSVSAHFIANTMQNIIHLQSDAGLDVMVALRGTVASITGLLSLFFIKWLADKYRLPQMKPWPIE